jgi:CDP-glycerol glycerophosphotransferase
MTSEQPTMEQALQLEQRREWEAAVAAYTGMLNGAKEVDAQLKFRLAHAHFHLRQFSEAVPVLQEATLLDPSVASWHYRLGFLHEQLGNYAEAREAYKASLGLAPRRTRWQHRLEALEAAARLDAARPLDERRTHGVRQRQRVQELASRPAPEWEQVEALQDGLAFHSDDPGWLLRLADGQFAMNRFAEASENYAAAALLKPDQADIHFREGWCWDILEQPRKARRAYRRAIAADTVLQAKSFGIGVFFQETGRWVAAAKAFKGTLRGESASAELHYKLGFALARSYSWHESIESLRTAVAMNPAVPEWHYQLGFAQERLGSWHEAASAYEYAIHLSTTACEYWRYRLGYVLTQAEDYEAACLSFAASRTAGTAGSVPCPGGRDVTPYEQRLLTEGLAAALQSQSAQLCCEAGERLELRQMFPLAAAAFDAGVRRMESHSPDAYYSLGRALQQTGDFEAACRAYLETCLFKRAHGMDTSAYPDKEFKQSMIYTEYLETLPLSTSTVLYESAQGNSVSCNPLQICRTLLADPRFEPWTHVWVLNDKERIPHELAGRTNVIFVARDSDLYLRYLSTAPYLINNDAFPSYFVRRPEQKYLNTWHGTPLKTLGRDIKHGFLDHRHAARNFLHTTHMIAPNDFTANCLLDRHDVAGIFPGKLAITGDPRIDATVGASGQQKVDLRRSLGMPEDQKIVLYAPSRRNYRSAPETGDVDVAAVMQQLAALDCMPLYRGDALNASDGATALEEFVVPEDIATNDLLAVVDVLISDYSSIVFDFMATGKPIVYFAYDLEDFSAERGLYFDLETLPGRVCRGAAGLLREVAGALGEENQSDEKYRRGVDTFCPAEDGSAAQRAIDFFFFDADRCVVPPERTPKTNVLFYQGSFVPDAITASYLNLVSNVDPISTRVLLAIEPSAVQSDERRLENFLRQPGHVQVLGRVGEQLLTVEECSVIETFHTLGDLPCPELWQIYHRAFEREFKRLFGYASFDAVVCFDGYATYWAALFANATSPEARKSIYLHNDMYREWRDRWRHLDSIFRLYRSYDELLSVTKSAHEDNVSHLPEAFGLAPEKFNYRRTPIKTVEAMESASDPLEENPSE